MATDNTAWQVRANPGRRTLVTGGAGFIGSHLVDRLVELGHQVIAVDDLSTGRMANLVDHPSVERVAGSVLDAPLLDELTSRVDEVYHLAAAVGVNTILKDPLRSLRTNLHGTEIVLNAALRHQVQVMVMSSSEVYGMNTSDGLTEDDDRVLGSPLLARWSYAEAKAVVETLAYAYWRNEGLPTVIVRPFNIVGPRQTGRYGMVIPRLVGQALRDEPLSVYGDGRQTRCFCHVREAVDAMVALIGHPDAYGQAFNLGRPEEVSIRELAERVIELSGSSSSIQYVPYSKAYGEGFQDMRRRVPDITKLRDLIGFEPRLGLDTIVMSVLEDQRQSRTAELSTLGGRG
ncbi:UDP-glucose 4-epimerase [Microtetraspora sp. NBRC 13810]|uniref:NAD-dependent epimerase/dehydratase family protein n=1 Tax=Microtetraspora sp. NBRC 13810 TaxID=3030990 RepID=UPI0024A036AD|nr:NAD-dependent epimerase/dehydratase family protein [Microtetraspora sp. NBRC 13810]GLW05857.1 UDP-glucose 4-epimerase [Microtetraspora sp. NBRC 13810]